MNRFELVLCNAKAVHEAECYAEEHEAKRSGQCVACGMFATQSCQFASLEAINPVNRSHETQWAINECQAVKLC